MISMCGYCRAPITDSACLVCGGTGHRPEAVLEMPRGEFWWCIKCSQPWPCPEAPDRRTSSPVDPVDEDGFVYGATIMESAGD